MDKGRNIIQVIGGKYYKVLKDNKFGVVNYTGKTILEPKYEYISVITVQDGNEFVFECQNADNYDFINEMETKKHAFEQEFPQCMEKVSLINHHP